LKNVILTNRFERPYNPLFGADIRNRLFENFDLVEQVNIEEDIKAAINNFEPRVRVSEVTAISAADSNAVQINITFYIVNEVQPLTVGIQIERTR
jgi:phage baseplate assembly protein W